MPFGIKTAPEHYQKKMNEILEGLDGQVCIIDDILIHGKTQKEHDTRLRAVLKKLDESGATLNPEKCEFSKKEVKFAGCILNEEGIKSDPDKIEQENGERQPIAYASRSMTSTEQRYAQIEKEVLATTWACEKFNDYILEKDILIETDHKPLVPLFGTKLLDQLPPRIQRFKRRLMKYSFYVNHIPGKELVTADTLSRAPIRKPPTKVDKRLTEDLSLYVANIFESLPASERKLEEIRLLQQDDEVCRKLSEFFTVGWPGRTKLNSTLLAYWPERGNITAQRVILMKDTRLVIPSSLRLDTLDKIHAGHQGIRKCRERARESVWWPGLSKQIEDMVTTCPTCCKHRQNHAEPMIASPLPERHWQKIATDLFHHNGKYYVIALDYYSRFFEVAPLKNTTSENVVNHLKSFSCRHGIPEIVMSDNGPQFSAATFSKFADEWGFTHLTSNPYYPQSNGEAERAVKTAKSLFAKSEDPYLALLSYRTTPLQNGHLQQSY
ncbi:Transposon Ty3-I Gag-Pol poly [Paramuricea clavata]|uniref:Transposon Ty3-I Gag-Pol poly n=1 Tax=Paramuricea clavata TaxID=317549 RepID=A0A6S7H131_PARCT|nr:Transposon Ty3-I Gag-Pol poly [Paramuricea clavata]